MSLFWPQNQSDINGIVHNVKNYKSLISCESSNNEKGFECDNSLDPSKDLHYHSDLNENSYVIYSLLKHKLYITHYSYQGPNNTKEVWKAPKSWTFSGLRKNKEEQETWIELDNVNESNILQPLQIITRSVNNNNIEPFSEFKFQMYGLNYNNQQDLRIFKFDLFGQLFPSLSQKNSVYKTWFPLHPHTIFISIIIL